MIEKGNKFRVSDNGPLRHRLEELGFEEGASRRFAAQFVGTVQTAHDIWTDSEGHTFVTVDLCCEIPVECCEAV